MRTIAYDVKLRRPGCALLQAALGCDPALASAFPTDTWLLAPTDDLKVYPIPNDEFLQRLVETSVAG